MAKRNTPNSLGVAVPKIEIRSTSTHQNQMHVSNHHSHPYTTADTAMDSEESRIDKLSLIFRNEPEQIQQKLVKLLVRMQFYSLYKNKDQDMFQVDLLIPFQNEDQKKHFMRQFLEIRRQKNIHFMGQTFGTPHQKQHQQIQWIGSYNEGSHNQPRKFSFNSNNQNHESNKVNMSQNFSHQKENRSRVSSVTTNKHEKIVEELNINNQTGQFQDIIVPVVEQKKDEKINFEALGEVIARRLRVAVDIINLSKENMSASQSSYQQAYTINSNEGRQESSIIDQISNSISLGSTQKISQSKHGKQESELQLQPSIHFSKDEPIMMQRKLHEANYTSENPHYMQITEQPEEEEYQPLFNQENKEKHTLHSKVTAFEDYARQYASIKQGKQNKNKAKPTHPTQRHSNSQKNYNQQKANVSSYQSQRPQKTGKNVSVSNTLQDKNQVRSINSNKKVDANLNFRSKSQQKKDSQEARKKMNNQINVFFNTYRKSLDRIYSQIRQRIQDSDVGHKNQEDKKSFEDLYILVRDDQSGQGENLSAISEQDDSSTFKDQIIKQYHQQILVTNQNLSSEDLVRYFRYLHSNAKKLYIRYLKNRNK